jgi:cytoskeletal protein RodZ
LDEIGKNFKLARVDSGLSLEEVSNDTKIPVNAIEQIEEGNI